tara:strand:+ start:296 stop:2110 length:1815 start_codon:yes stop_codon:yes gene_type:complete
MKKSPHIIHIPVMGTGFSIDSAIRVAHFGISTVISIIDDLLVEKIRKHYCNEYSLPYSVIPRWAEDGRAKRISAYLEMVKVIVEKNFKAVQALPFFEQNDKEKYFKMLPENNLLRIEWQKLLKMDPSELRDKKAVELSSQMSPGSIDVNIMAKVDRMNTDKNGNPLSEIYSDARSALRGYASTSLESSIIFSAGINQGLYSYMTEFKDFYRDASGKIKKKIILKVSDFRSALIQGKFLAKKGLEVHEFRIESGLNCGGHAFASNGELLPVLLKEIREKRNQLSVSFRPLIEKYYEKMGWGFPQIVNTHEPLITVQGGIGTTGEIDRLVKDFGMDQVGIASPFLLVPEATCVDEPTRLKLIGAGEDDLYLSGASPLGVPFNNLRNSESQLWTEENYVSGKPGSPCPKGFLKSNTEFTEDQICTASCDYQGAKIDEVDTLTADESARKTQHEKVILKTCLCDHLGNGALLELGIARKDELPTAICPGQNTAWFNRDYSLLEMTDHFYGRTASLVDAVRPHMFAKEIQMYVDYFSDLVEDSDGSNRTLKTLQSFYDNMIDGLEYCLEISGAKPYIDENLDSINEWVDIERKRLTQIYKSINFEPQLA